MAVTPGDWNVDLQVPWSGFKSQVSPTPSSVGLGKLLNVLFFSKMQILVPLAYGHCKEAQRVAGIY